MPFVDESGTPELSILVVSYNCPGDVKACFDSLSAGGGDDVAWEFLVCENGMDRRQEMRALAEQTGFRLVEPEENLGFGRANNALSRQARGKFLLLLNPDTEVPRLACRRLINRLSATGCMVAAPVLTNTDGSSQFSWNVPMGLAWEFAEVHYLQNIWRRAWRRHFLSTIPNGPWEVGFSSGACLCMETRTFLGLGGFDEDFFLNHEDIELCDRIRQSGKVFVFPEIEVRHLDGGTQRKDWSRFVKDRLDAKWIYLGKRYRGLRLLIAKLLWLEGMLIRIAISSMVRTAEGRSRRVGYIAALRNVLGAWARP